eukprot:4129656-Prymnesium_polylepis.1
MGGTCQDARFSSMFREPGSIWGNVRSLLVCLVLQCITLGSTLLTARRQRTGTVSGEDTDPHPHNPSRPLRSRHHMHTTK